MDDATLAGLEAALAATPDNGPLLGIVLAACAERGDVERGLSHLGAREPGDLDPKGCLAAARLLAARGETSRGRAFYDAAVAASAALEDTELAARLRGAPVDVPEGRPPLRLLSSGDTERLDEVDEVDEVASSSPARARRTVTFADVGGLEELKDRIRRKVVLPLQKPALFARFRKRTGGGVLLYGPPGCGKTLIARATAGEVGARFFSVAISDVLDMWLGESEQKLHAIFEEARAAAPSVLFFDEVEALGGRRRSTTRHAASNLVSQFLGELDGFDGDNAGVLVLGATNLPWAVDPAFRRPGRFDRVLFVPPPDRPARQAILDLHLAERPLAEDVRTEALAERTSGWSGADLAELVETAAELAIEASIAAEVEVPINQAHLRAALGELRPSTGEWLSTARNHARFANDGGQYDEVLAWLERDAGR